MVEDQIKLKSAFVKVHPLVKDWAEDILDDLKYRPAEWCNGSSLEEIENESRSGFIPYTAGGWNGIGHANLGDQMGSGCYPKMMQSYVSNAEKDVVEEWESQNPGKKVDALEDGSDDQEAFYNFENEYHREGHNYFFKVRAIYLDDETGTESESGEPEVYFMVGINTDFEYGRDTVSWLKYMGGDPQCTKWLWEKTVKAAEVTQELVDQFKKEAIEAFLKA